MNEQITTAARLDALPPLQHLVLEVLAARHRLGESLWTFTAHASTVRAIHALEAAGLIEAMGGIVPRTVRASLTDKGRAAALSATYHRPDAPERTEPTEEQVLTVLRAHGIECTGLGEVTCVGCRSAGWMTWGEYRLHLARAILALLPQRVAPSEEEVQEAVFSALRAKRSEESGVIHANISIIAARAILALFGSQPTVADVRAKAAQETLDSYRITDAVRDVAYERATHAERGWTSEHDAEETPDPACRRAAADNARRSRERTGNRRGRFYSQARSRALTMLKEAHPVEFRMLLEAVEAEMRAARADS
jgi:DNA-binding MarR family transcriptional regulator